MNVATAPASLNNRVLNAPARATAPPHDLSTLMQRGARQVSHSPLQKSNATLALWGAAVSIAGGVVLGMLGRPVAAVLCALSAAGDFAIAGWNLR